MTINEYELEAFRKKYLIFYAQLSELDAAVLNVQNKITHVQLTQSQLDKDAQKCLDKKIDKLLLELKNLEAERYSIELKLAQYREQDSKRKKTLVSEALLCC